MKRIAFAALAAASLVLSACGGGGNSACHDEASTKAYMEKWQADMTAAASAGKIDPAKLSQAQQDMMNDISSVKEGDYAGLCGKLDDLRKKVGF